jgi:uncharacterized protein
VGWAQEPGEHSEAGVGFCRCLGNLRVPDAVALDERADYGEDRWIGIGLLGLRVVVVAYTELDAETIRIISLRKALSHERNRYEQAIRDQLGSS